MSNPGMAKQLRQFDALTSLRGIGAIWVTVFHMFEGSPFDAVNKGYLGVDLFFILSGFILCHVHAKEFENFSLTTYTRFLQLRLWRVYPLHVFILICFATFVFSVPGVADRYPNPGRLDLPHLFASLLLVHNWGWGPAPLWNGPTWSLSAEWLAYLTFPIFVGFSFKVVPEKMVLPAALLVLFLLEAIMLAKGQHGGMGKAGLIRMAAEFCAGCLLFRFSTAKLRTTGQWLPWLAIILLFISIQVPNMLFLASFGFFALIYCVVQERNFLQRTLASKGLVFLGNFSFSLYMCHWPLIQVSNWLVATNHMDQAHSLPFQIAAISIATLLCWKYIENPARQLGRRFVYQR